MQNLNVNSMIDKFYSRIPDTIVALTGYEPVSSEIAKVLITVNKDSTTKESLYRAVCDSLDGKATPVLGSFRAIDNSNTPTIVGYVSSVIETREYKENSNLTVLSANLLMDPEDETLWEVHSNNGQNFLVRHQQEDLTQLLELCRVRQHGVPSLGEVVISSVEDKNCIEIVAYVDSALSEVRLGGLVARGERSWEVIAFDTGSSNRINPHQVVETLQIEKAQAPHFPDSKLDVLSADDAGTSHDRAVLVDYYRKVFGYNPEFFGMLTDIINDHAVM